MKQNEAETIALNALSFLVGNETRLERFMSLSGMDATALKDNASDPAFLAGILDYLLQDETLVYMFAEEYNLSPALPATARRTLVGGNTGDFH